MKRCRARCLLVLTSLFLSQLFATAIQDPNLRLERPVLTNNQVRLTLHCNCRWQYFIESSTNLLNWIRVATNDTRIPTRTILVNASGDTRFYRAVRGRLNSVTAGILANESISFKGNSIYVDAYDSAFGEYNPTNAFAGGDLASNGLIDIGNAAVHGWVILTESASFSIGPSGLVGDLPANWPAQSGVQGPEWLVQSGGFDNPDVQVPYTSGLPPSPGTGTNTYELGTGNYFWNGDFTLNNHEILYVSGNATFYVTGSLNAKNGSSIVVAPGALLRFYVGAAAGPAVSVTVNTIVNSGATYEFIIYGLPTCTNVVLNCTPAYRGAIYAPAAALTVSGNGNCATDFQGACVVNSASIKGTFSFHFDWNLTRSCGSPR